MLMRAYVHQTLTVLKINPRTLSVCVGGGHVGIIFSCSEKSPTLVVLQGSPKATGDEEWQLDLIT